METTSARATAVSPTAATAAAAAAPTTAAAKGADAAFDTRLAAELKRIESHATTIETLDNGAKIYHLSGGRQIEAAPGKTPYVIVKGDWPAAKATAGTTGTTATTTPPATGATTATAPNTTVTTGANPPTTTGTTTGTGTTPGTGTTTGNGDTTPFEPTSQP